MEGEGTNIGNPKSEVFQMLRVNCSYFFIGGAEVKRKTVKVKDLKLPIFLPLIATNRMKDFTFVKTNFTSSISQGKVGHFKSGIEVLHEKFTFSTTKRTSNGQISHPVNKLNPTREVPHFGYNFEYVPWEALESDNRISIL